jgi:hypothetical protein
VTPLFANQNMYYHLPFLLIAVSLVYSATRHDRWDQILREAAGWIVRMVSFLGGLGVALYVLTTFPKLWPYAAGAFGAVMLGYYIASSSLFRKVMAKPAPVPPAVAASQKK